MIFMNFCRLRQVQALQLVPLLQQVRQLVPRVVPLLAPQLLQPLALQLVLPPPQRFEFKIIVSMQMKLFFFYFL
jgi:hypothetical protein